MEPTKMTTFIFVDGKIGFPQSIFFVLFLQILLIGRRIRMYAWVTGVT